MDTELKGKVVVVAAASQGIGRACAEAFAREGATLAICSRNQDSIEAAAIGIRKHGVPCSAHVLDVTQHEAVRSFIKAVTDQHGRVDVCVTNAGGPPAKGFLETTEPEWR